MKKKNVVIVAITLCIITITPCQAQRVTINEAKAVAQTYLGRDTTQLSNRVARVLMKTDSLGNPLMYEVILNDSTIVLVSGNRATIPVTATKKLVVTR